jgi:uncharacterized protein (TIGR03086 family)
MDFRAPDRSALDLAGEVIAQVTSQQLALSTPCPGWTLADLLRHMIGQNKRFAAAAEGADANAVCPLAGDELSADPAGDYQESVRLVTEAFAAPGLAGRRVVLDELPGGLPGPVVVGFHFTDFLVHGWDVARSIGVRFEPPADLASAALGLARQIPDTPQTRGPGGPFGQPVQVPETASDYDRLLGIVGRDPAWTATGGSA